MKFEEPFSINTLKFSRSLNSTKKKIETTCRSAVCPGPPEAPQDCKLNVTAATGALHLACLPGFDGGLRQMFRFTLYSAKVLFLCPFSSLIFPLSYLIFSLSSLIFPLSSFLFRDPPTRTCLCWLTAPPLSRASTSPASTPTPPSSSGNPENILKKLNSWQFN